MKRLNVLLFCAAAAAASADSGLVLKTSDGRRWTGSAPRIQILAPAAGQPELARINFAVTNSAGERLGVYAELNTADLFGKAWEVQIDGRNPTKPGLGVLSYGTADKPEIADSGRLTIEVRGSKLTGKFESSADTVQSATFEGAFGVECLVPNRELSRPVDGSLSSGEALGIDEGFESGFCRAFKKLGR